MDMSCTMNNENTGNCKKIAGKESFPSMVPLEFSYI